MMLQRRENIPSTICLAHPCGYFVSRSQHTMNVKRLKVSQILLSWGRKEDMCPVFRFQYVLTVSTVLCLKNKYLIHRYMRGLILQAVLCNHPRVPNKCDFGNFHRSIHININLCFSSISTLLLKSWIIYESLSVHVVLNVWRIVQQSPRSSHKSYMPFYT